MGIRSWWQARKQRKLEAKEEARLSQKIRDVRHAVSVLQQFAGKDRAELQREGGWDIVAGNDWSWLSTVWKDANDIWQSYTVRDMEITYSIASAIHACVRLKATTANQIFMEVGTWTRSGWMPLEDHGLYDLMKRPNGGQDTSAFVWDIVSHAELTGWSYVWKLRNKGGEIIAVQPLPTSWVSRDYDERTGLLRSYRVRKSGTDTELIIAPEDMFYIQYPNPADPTQASGPLQAALKDLQVDDARSNLLIEMLTNIHFPGAIFKSEHNWTPDDKDEARAVLKDVIGPGRRANPLFVNGKNTEVQLPEAPKDMDWPGTAMQAESRICAAFGVPPILVHLRSGLEHGTYSNYGQARKSFYNDTMRSLWELMASAFERGLFIDEGETRLEIEPDFERIPEMQEDQSERHKRIRDDFHGGLLMWDEAVEMVGGKPLPGNMGKVYLLPMGLQQIAISPQAGGGVIDVEEDEDIEEEPIELEDEHLEDADVTEVDDEEEESVKDAEAGKSIIILPH
jgi:HK97 family phage portal protein